MRRYVAEVIATFALVFAGTGAAVVNDVTGGVVTHIGISITFGLIVTAMIHAVGDVSGAHMNPAVTVGFWLSKRFPAREVAPYIASQCIGAVAASALLGLIFLGEVTSFGATVPAGSVVQSLALEVVITFFLMFVILGATAHGASGSVLAGIVIGGTVALCALFAGPISGASMNPARSLGPALVSGELSHMWLYVVGPVAGAALAVAGYRAVYGSKAV